MTDLEKEIFKNRLINGACVVICGIVASVFILAFGWLLGRIGGRW